MVQNIYGVPPPPPEDHHKSIDFLNTIVQGMQKRSYEMKGLAQTNAVRKKSNYEVMEQLLHMTATINVMQAQLKTLSATSTN